jgi:cysteine desulfurase
MAPIYLDYNASTPIDPAVAGAMRPLLEEAYGNPSGGHWASRAGEGRLGERTLQGQGAPWLRFR